MYQLKRIIVFIKVLQRTRLQPIRTASEIEIHIVINPVQRVYLYQKIAQKAKELHLLGMSHRKIAASLKVSKRTVAKACKAK